MDGFHHVLKDGVQELARLLGIALGEQFHRALEVGEEHRDLFALALEGRLGGEDLLGEVLGSIGVWRGETRLSGLVKRRCTLSAEFVRRRVTGSARWADGGKRCGALAAESCSGAI